MSGALFNLLLLNIEEAEDDDLLLETLVITGPYPGGWRWGRTPPPGKKVEKKIIAYGAISLVHCNASSVTLASDDRCQTAFLQGLPECNINASVVRNSKNFLGTS